MGYLIMLPPPNWSPTGNSGTWYWDEYNADPKTGKARACWKFHDDVLGAVNAKDLRDMEACGSPKGDKLTWWQKIFRK